MKKIIGMIGAIVIGCVSVFAYAGSDRYVGEYAYHCSGFVELKDGRGGFKPEQIMAASCRADEDSEAQRKFHDVFEENGNRVNDPVECHKQIQNR